MSDWVRERFLGPDSLGPKIGDPAWFAQDLIAAELADGIERDPIGEVTGTGLASKCTAGTWVSVHAIGSGSYRALGWPPRCMWIRYLDGYVLRRVA